MQFFFAKIANLFLFDVILNKPKKLLTQKISLKKTFYQPKTRFLLLEQWHFWFYP